MVSTLHDNKVIVVGIGEKGLYKLVDLKTSKNTCTSCGREYQCTLA
jgi:hypothetical protein